MADKSRSVRMSFCAVAGLVCGTLASGSVPGSAAAAEDVVRAGIQIGALGALRTTIQPIGKKYNIKFEIKDFRDSTSAMKALDQGEIQIANTTAQHLVRAISEGIKVVWVSGWDGGNNLLVAGKGFDAGADSTAVKNAIMKRQAAGKPVKIGVPTGSMQHAKLLQYLTSIGVGEKDVDIVNVPFPVHPRALGAGEVDMAMTLAPFGALAIEKLGAKEVKHLYGGPYGKQEIGFIVQKSLIDKNPKLVQRIVSSIVESMNKYVGDKDAHIAFEKKYSRFPPSVIETTQRKYLRYHYKTNITDLRAMAGQLHKLGWMKVDLSSKIDSVVNLEFLSKATGKPVAELSRW